MALRRQASQSAQNERAIVSKLKDLICENHVVLIGPVRQELLSGLRDEASFAKLQSHLASFPDEPLVTEDYEEAARCHNQCRSSGIAGSSVDMLICAAARRRTLTIFTSDEDFRRYAEIPDPRCLHRIHYRTRVHPRPFVSDVSCHSAIASQAQPGMSDRMG